MPGIRTCPSIALLRYLRQAPTSNPPIRAICATQQRQFSSSRPNGEEKEERPDFRAQLYQSTYQRLERERAEQERLSKVRGQLSTTSRWQFTISTLISSLMYHLLTFLVLLAFTATAYLLGVKKIRPPPTTSTLPLDSTVPPKHKTSHANLQAAWDECAAIVGKENVSIDQDNIESHSGSDWSSYTPKDLEKPFLIVSPSTTEEVSKIMKACHERRMPVTAYSGGTSLEGHFSATRGGITMDFNRMDKILKLHKDDLDVVVQPAVGWEILNEELGKEGLFFPPDPGPGKPCVVPTTEVN